MKAEILSSVLKIQTRNVMWRGAVDIIYRTLEKTGLLHDEGPDKDGGFGPYVQSERQATGMYLKYAKQLIEQEMHITASAARKNWKA